MLRFGLFGIPVKVRWTFWLMTAFLSYHALLSKSPEAPVIFAAWVVAVFVSILWHELGHAVFQKKFGMRAEIELYHFGGLATGSGRSLTKNQSLIMTAAGPGAGLILGGAVLLLYFLFDPVGANQLVSNLWNGIVRRYPMPWFAEHREFIHFLIVDLLAVNFFWSLVNLVPVLPLDGGQIMNTLNGPAQAKRTLKISIGAGVAMVVVGLVIGQSFMSMLFVFLTIQNVQRLQGGSRPMFGAPPPRRPF